jgi:SAM-dependent methyltransferase
VQLDSYTGRSWSRERFEREVPWADSLRGGWVVDAGCGAGRFAEVAASFGAEVIAVDLSSAVDAVARNLAAQDNVHPIQADLAALPLRPGVLSGAYSIGVLQHTPDPVAMCRRLLEQLPAGAWLSVTIYGRGPWTKLYPKYWVRPITRRLDPATLLWVIEKSMPVLFPLTSALFRIPLVGRLFRLAIPVANYVDLDYPSRKARYDEAVLDTFDMLSPAHDHPVTLDEVLGGVSGLTAGIRVVSRAPIVVTLQRAA